MNRKLLEEFIKRANACAHILIDNAAFIGNEIPAMDIADARRLEIEDLCEKMFGTKHDVVSEIFDMEEAADEQANSRTIQGRVTRMYEWIFEDVKALHGLVKSLEAEDDGGLLYLLIAGAGMNIVNSFGPVRQAFEAYRESLKIEQE